MPNGNFKKAIEDGEKDRMVFTDLSEDGDQSLYGAKRVHVTDKRITIETKFHKYNNDGPDAGYKTEISFEKMNNRERDGIEIETRKWEKRTRVKKCDMGHDHVTSEYNFDTWQRVIMTWDQFEALLEWFQTGRFYDARSKQGKANGRVGFHSTERL